jgi:hypothetical protein
MKKIKNFFKKINNLLYPPLQKIMSDEEAWNYDWSMVMKDLSDVVKDFEVSTCQKNTRK